MSGSSSWVVLDSDGFLYFLSPVACLPDSDASFYSVYGMSLVLDMYTYCNFILLISSLMACLCSEIHFFRVHIRT